MASRAGSLPLTTASRLTLGRRPFVLGGLGVVSLIVALVAGVALGTVPVAPGDTVAILVQHTTVKDPAAWQTARPAPINPNGYTYPENIQRSHDYFLTNGMVQQRVDLGQVIDHSFVDYALERLGRLEN